MDKKDGDFAVKLARQAVNLWVKKKEKFSPKDFPPGFKEPRGVFVTIHTWPKKELRGCIGFPGPFMPLIKGIVEAAIQSTQDPRFNPLGPDELNRIVIEVSILTKPELIQVKNPKEYAKKIKIGQDGLIVKKGHHSGLLLPQVATEHGLDAEDFLIETCIKAGLPPTAWTDPETGVYKFQTEIFEEKKPYSI